MHTTAVARSGTARRDGVRIAYETAGDGDQTVVLLPAWMITNRRMWAAQVAALSRRFRVVTFDSRGTGASDRPLDAAAYGVTDLVADAAAVLKATGTERAVLVGNSLGGLVGFLLAARVPERVAGLVLIGASVDLAGGPPSALQRANAQFEEQPTAVDGWARYNRHSWRRDYPGFVAWFVRTALGEHATGAARADGLAQGLDVGPDVLAATVAARSRPAGPAQAAMLRGVSTRIECPVLVVHGGRDEICPASWSTAQARALGARRVVLPEAGHCPQVTHPGEITDLITAFVTETRP